MGTNFYAVHIPTKEEHKTLEELLNSKKYEELKELLGKSTQRYHIGKRSCDWAFLFQANSKNYDEEVNVPWDDNIDSLIEYLNRPDIKIVDEYGKEFTSDQFWEEEVGDSLYVHEDTINNRYYDDIETYYSRPENSIYRNFDTYEKTVDKIRWCSTGFA